MPKIIVVDDQESIRVTLSSALSELKHEVAAFEDGSKALEAFRKDGADLIISDVRMPNMDGFSLLKAVKNVDPSVRFIIMTAYSSIDDAISAMKLGALDYITKPFDLVEMEAKVKRIFAPPAKAPQGIKGQILEKYEGHVSRNENMVQVYEIAKKASQNRSSVLIRGDSGTGKELIAKAIHFNGKDVESKPFIKVNCAALAEGVLESELFGHEKGAFTGALNQRMGKFEAARGGTIFLDEIGDVPLNTQVKLLRVLQEKEFERVGGNETIKIDVRIITATNKNLEEMIENALFREDLFYRLNVIPIYLPPLRERPEDIPELIDHFIEKNRGSNTVEVTRCTNDLVDTLCSYYWPGNIRELENLIERMVVLSDEPVLSQASLPYEIKTKMTGSPPNAKTTFHERSGGYEKNLIIQALEKCGNKQVEAAKYLKMDRSTLRYKMKKYGLL